MLAVMDKSLTKIKEDQHEKKNIFVTKYEEKETYENGKKIIERVPHTINVTKLVNETAKVVKQDQAKELINKMTKLLEKEGKK